LNRKEGFALSALIFISLVGTVFAEGISPNTPTSGPTLQTTSVDIEALKVVPAIASPGGTSGLILLSVSSGAKANFSAAFPFAPVKGFVQVTSVRLTLLYVPVQFTTGDGFSVQLNGATPNIILMRLVTVTNSPTMLSGPLRSQDLRVGSNGIEIGLLLGGAQDVTYIYEVRLTVEYTFLG